MSPPFPESPQRSSRPGRRFWRFLFRDAILLESETAWFILVNLLDYWVTYLLLLRGNFREANPVALWFLERWGPGRGLLWYKLVLVTFVCVIAQIVARHNETTARRLIAFGIVIVSLVVLYSLKLLMQDMRLL